MIVAFPFFQGDANSMLELMKWIKDLGPCKNHDAILISDERTQWSAVTAIKVVAEQVFNTVEMVLAPATDGWPQGANELFLTAVKACRRNHWLWMEADAIPLKRGWLDELNAEYLAIDTKFLGEMYPWKRVGEFETVMSGIAVYAADTINYLPKHLPSAQAFDVAYSEVFTTNGANTKLIFHLFGEMDKPPTFADKQVAGTNIFSLDQIRKEAVIFHRNKDHSLIRLLREKHGIRDDVVARPERIDDLVVVLPFCEKDWFLMRNHLQWLTILHKSVIPMMAVLHADRTVRVHQFNEIEALARQVFGMVVVSRYDNSPRMGWPAACNWAFQRALFFMETRIKKPWFFFEPDAVALSKHWAWMLRDEYYLAGKPFMGSIVGDFDNYSAGHMNGVGIYPARCAPYTRRIYTVSDQAWDTAWRDEVGRENVAKLCHDASHLMQHCGAVLNGKCKPANGDLPKFPDQATVDSILTPRAVIFHPSKTSDLIERLVERIK